MSAKSIFTSPTDVNKSVILVIPCSNILSAKEKALFKVIFVSVTFNKLSFKTTIKSSTLFFNLSVPFSALKPLAFPSNINGFVTIPIVSIPISLAISATIGAAPVPVPPPIPAVIKTKSAPLKIFFISSLFSIAALSPTISFAPAPNPLVVCIPICKVLLVFDLLNVPVSVFII